MIKQIKKALPDCKIGIIPAPAWGSNNLGNQNWETYVVPWIEHCMIDVENYKKTISGLEIISMWAHINRDFNFVYSATEDILPLNKSKRGTRTEYVHWDETGKIEYTAVLSAYVMNVI